MPRVLFTDDVEGRLIELWGDYQRTKNGTMLKRSLAERQIADKLNDYAKEIGLGSDVVFTGPIVHSKVDNLKTKAKELYKRYRRRTATGSPVGDPGKDDSYDLQAAIACWTNFKSWHRIFRDMPGYGPLQTLSSVSVLEVPESDGPGTSSTPTSPVASAVADGKSTPSSAGAADVSDEDLLLGKKTLDANYSPFTTPKARKHKEVIDSDDDSDDAGAGQKMKKKKKTKSAASTSPGSLAVAENIVKSMSETQRELQRNQQQFLAGLMREQQTHAQNLMKSQMKFQGELLAELFKSGRQE